MLIVIGTAWGATVPLNKIAVSTGHGSFGLIFWQLVVGIVLLGALTLARGAGLPLGRREIATYLIIAFIGTLAPNSTSYEAVRHVPAGIVSIALALIPMLAFPMALLMGTDRFGPVRLLGLGLGLAGMLLIALPEASLPEHGMAAYLPLVLIAPLFYAFEGNYVAKWGTGAADAIQTLLGASIAGTILILPIVLATGQWIDPLAGIGRPEAALVLSACIHSITYAAFIWLVARAGAVFSSQVAYIVTGAGVIWSMLVLGETYSGWIWLSLAAMMGGLFLVQPRTEMRGNVS
jgi:drug/metabolite transporter (DMT)-like permease